MEIRITTEQDLPEVKELWAYCFENYEPFFSWYFREYYQAGNTLAAFAADRMLSNLQLIPYEIKLRGQVLPTSYIVGVASFPEARRGGIVGKLLEAALVEMRLRGQGICLLMPFKAGFYYPYQFEFCYHHYKYNISLDQLGPVSESYGEFVPVRGLERVAELAKVYQEFVGDKHGYMVRDSTKWRLMLEEHAGEKGYTYLLRNRDIPEGYLMYYLKDDKLVVREMAYSNFRAQKSLLQFIYNHRSQAADLEWHAPIDDAIHFLLPDPKEGITLYPFLMARIVDVQNILAKISFPRQVRGELVISFQDKLAAWNNQTFSIKIVNGQAEVSPVDGTADISVDIGAFTQVLLGRLTAREIYKQGRLTAAETKKLDILDEMFPRCLNYINEYY
ncbi:MAG: GNAT family N-acetyltransferase [Peptococcaceae bacterium]